MVESPIVGAVAIPVGGSQRRRQSAKERFGVKPNPFAGESAHAVGRTAEFRRISALKRREAWADLSDALTLALAKPAVPPGSCPADCPCKGTGSMKLRPRQAWALAELFEERGGIAMLGPGDGKAQPVDANVIVPRGTKRMGDLKIGDEICTPNGGVAHVIGVFPQGVKDIFKITFSDGASTECCEDHLWPVRDKRMRKNNARSKSYVQTNRPKKRPTFGRSDFEIHPLREIAEEFQKVKERQQVGAPEYSWPFDIPLAKPVFFEQRFSLPIPAYTMGVLLGDGGLGSSNTAVDVHTSDRDCDEMFRFLRVDLSNARFFPTLSKDRKKIGIRNKYPKRDEYTIQGQLRKLGLLGTLSHTKFIPDVYKVTSVENRWQILRGLLDTDGTVEKNGSVSFTTVSRRLADDVRWLVESLGGNVAERSRIPFYTYKGERKRGKLAFTIVVRLMGGCPVRLAFKRARWHPLTKYVPTRYIINIEKVGQKEARCILLDSDDHLYLTDRFIVTHNTIVSAMLPVLLGWSRPVLFVPASLRNKTIRVDYPHLARHWKVLPLSNTLDVEGPSLEIRSYEELSQTRFSDYLSKRRVPDGIIADEAHNLKNRGAARTKRLLRYFGEFPDTEFAGLSGSIVHRSIMDYGHLLLLGLKDTAPVPHSFLELRTWADALDEGVAEHVRPKPGAMLDFCRENETIRDGYRRRLLETKGVISSPDLSTNIGLQVVEREHPKVPPNIAAAFQRLRNTAELPEGEMCTTMLDQTRHARELLLGFYYRWLWPDGKVDREWLKCRRAWRKYVRKMTTRSHGGIWLDTELQVAQAVLYGQVECSEDDVTDAGSIARRNVNVYEEWKAIREDRKTKWDGKPEPPKETKWLSDYMLRELEQWVREHSGDESGIVWVESIGFLEALRARAMGKPVPGLDDLPGVVQVGALGTKCFGAGENDIMFEDGKRSVFASLAHTVGKNLHAFHRMLFANPLQSGKAWEQALAREHRPGQAADDVVAELYLGCRETWWGFERSRLDANYIEMTLGQPQRLNKATLVVNTTEAVALAKCDNGDPLWALTGHAKIDGLLGVNVNPKTGEREKSATPLLTSMREEAKRNS